MTSPPPTFTADNPHHDAWRYQLYLTTTAPGYIGIAVLDPSGDGHEIRLTGDELEHFIAKAAELRAALPARYRKHN
ncbi:hypothetical protein ACFXO7_38925 [Nocardia tengchongensis]|uniref:hypothetical protein n=1 Tax=Nocardia tengchongensis TaxID=2055889 RepID=UPI00367532EA